MTNREIEPSLNDSQYKDCSYTYNRLIILGRLPRIYRRRARMVIKFGVCRSYSNS